jgi:hypothetical protein
MGKFLRLANGVIRSFDESSSPTIYDQNVTVGGGGLTTGQPITLPSSQTYDSQELEVYLNNVRLTPVLDYNYIGASAPRTQVSFTFDLLTNEVVRFRIDRGA